MPPPRSPSQPNPAWSAESSPTPADLSVAIVCKNNADTIGRVLDSVRGLARQLVIVDSGSTDGTLALIDACRSWAEVVLLETTWRGHIQTKQLALEACTSRHALALDSDEPIDGRLRESIRDACGRDISAARVNRAIEYRGRLLRHAAQPEWKLRLVRTDLVREGGAAWGGTNPHDRLEAPGQPAEDLPGILIHESFPTFEQHLRNQIGLQSVSARALRARGVRGSRRRLVTSPIGAFLKQIVLKSAWRDGRAGWLIAATAAAGALMKHMILLERCVIEGEDGPDRP